MAFRVFFACDIIGCKNTSDEISRSSGRLPDGWLKLADDRYDRMLVESEGIHLICPEHAKMFPKREFTQMGRT